jgi:hypothetical protein
MRKFPLIGFLSFFASNSLYFHSKKKCVHQVWYKMGFSLEEEYLKAKKMKQGSKYLADKIKKKFNMDVDKNQIIEILKQLGVKK